MVCKNELMLYFKKKKGPYGHQPMPASHKSLSEGKVVVIWYMKNHLYAMNLGSFSIAHGLTGLVCPMCYHGPSCMVAALKLGGYCPQLIGAITSGASITDHNNE